MCADFLIGYGRQVVTAGHILSGTEAMRVKLASGIRHAKYPGKNALASAIYNLNPWTIPAD